MANYSDIDFKLRKVSSTNDLTVVYDDAAINQSLYSLFNTIKGERVCNPEYGTNIQNLLFEPLDVTTGQSILNEIKMAIMSWEYNRIKIIELNVNVDFDNLAYDIFMQYQIINTQKLGVLSLTLQKI